MNGNLKVIETLYFEEKIMDKREIVERSKRCVCKYCGSPLEMRLVVFNRYGGEGVELYCPQCNRIEFGTEPEIYCLASEFVEGFEFNYFPDLMENEACSRMNVAKISQIFGWLLKRIDMLDRQGIKKQF